MIKGAEVAAQIREELKKEVDELKAKQGITPGRVTILVGEDPGSVSYVTAKQKTAHELGFYSVQENQSPDITEEALLALLERSGVEDKDAEEIANSVMDWRDPDDEKHLNGAETDYYEDDDYVAKNGPFSTVEELLLVNKMDADILYKPAYVTVAAEGHGFTEFVRRLLVARRG